MRARVISASTTASAEDPAGRRVNCCPAACVHVRRVGRRSDRKQRSGFSLFARFGPRYLPYMYIVVGLVTLPIMLAISALLARLDRRRVFSTLLIGLALFVAALRGLLVIDARWVYGAGSVTRERRSYGGDIERLDLMIGLYAEPLPRISGSPTRLSAVFILMASRRLNSDRFFTIDYRPEVYTQERHRVVPL